MRTKTVPIVLLPNMQLTRAADYAVRVMIHLASQPEGTVVSKATLAKASETPESFLSKILQSLARAGLIQARRGVVGGFLLLNRGAQASLLDVVESMDGPIALNVCLNSGVSCNRQAECSAHQVWQRAQSAMLAVLREATIAEMARQEKPCGNLLNIAQVTGAGRQKSKPLTRQVGVPAKPKRKARPRPAASGAARVAGKKQNTKI
jgi:Rrf2 family protein